MFRRIPVIPFALLVPLLFILSTAVLSADALVVNRSMFAETILEMDVREDRIIENEGNVAARLEGQAESNRILIS